MIMKIIMKIMKIILLIFMKILKEYQLLSVLVNNLFPISGCSESSTPLTVHPRQILDYKGDKLLLCSGHNLKDPNGDNYSYWKRNNYKSNEEWYTVNIGTHEKPDCVADLTKKKHMII